MAQHYQLSITDQHVATPRLRWLTLRAPELARGARAGHYLLVRCAAEGSYDPLLRRPGVRSQESGTTPGIRSQGPGTRRIARSWTLKRPWTLDPQATQRWASLRSQGCTVMLTPY